MPKAVMLRHVKYSHIMSRMKLILLYIYQQLLLIHKKHVNIGTVGKKMQFC
jgi:hypothetical protein